MSLVLQNFNFSSSLKRRTQSSVNSSASFSLTGLDFPVGFSIKPNDRYFKCDQKQEANSPRFCFRLVFPSENLHPIPSHPFTPSPNTSHANVSTKQEANTSTFLTFGLISAHIPTFQHAVTSNWI